MGSHSGFIAYASERLACGVFPGAAGGGGRPDARIADGVKCRGRSSIGSSLNISVVPSINRVSERNLMSMSALGCGRPSRIAPLDP